MFIPLRISAHTAALCGAPWPHNAAVCVCVCVAPWPPCVLLIVHRSRPLLLSSVSFPADKHIVTSHTLNTSNPTTDFLLKSRVYFMFFTLFFLFSAAVFCCRRAETKALTWTRIYLNRTPLLCLRCVQALSDCALTTVTDSRTFRSALTRVASCFPSPGRRRQIRHGRVDLHRHPDSQELPAASGHLQSLRVGTDTPSAQPDVLLSANFVSLMLFLCPLAALRNRHSGHH